ncbi:D-alanine-D-alanine ligase [hydrothermal vent metagenome]|uniref:D-alanine-D-alanine ligase n=1 Tax=hydrothermal vent metagenome TaxID=652676 RepID=A0A3B0X1M2_9ZZZZ
MTYHLLTKPESTIHQGMPELKWQDNKTTSLFEFWPIQLIYFPVVLQWLYLSLRHRSLSLPLIANTSIPLAGMVGESKSSILNIAGTHASSLIAPFICLNNDTSKNLSARMACALQKLTQAGITFPLVAKPDIGCRGAGVKIIHNCAALEAYLRNFPEKADLLLQKKINYEAEAGIFYVRHPGQTRGTISSITLKYSPYVIGDGNHSLRQLIEADPRARKISAIYLSRHQSMLDTIIPNKTAFRLSFAGSHSKGSIFRNGNQFISTDLTRAFDKIADDIDGFYYGRFDIRFENTNQLMLGESFSILEINGASAEAAHIWDRNTSLRDVYKTLFHQYKTLFHIGHLNRKNGHRPPSIWQLLKAWRKESRLVRQYPETD